MSAGKPLPISNEPARLAHSNCNPVRIVIAEDHPIVRQGFKMLLGLKPRFQVVGEAVDGFEAIRVVEKVNPDILLLDLDMPRLNGLETIRQLKHNRVRIIVFSAITDEPSCVEALRNGAAGYVLKKANPQEITEAILTVHGGQTYFSNSITTRAISEFLNATGFQSDPVSSLSSRERTVLQMAAEGYTSDKIAVCLFVSSRTVETHRANLMRKLGLNTQTDLVRFAVRNNLMSP